MYFRMASFSDCNLTKPISHGSCFANTTTYQSKAECLCDAGYTLHGEHFTECLSDGSWSDANITCIIKGNIYVIPHCSALFTLYNLILNKIFPSNMVNLHHCQ